MFNIAGISNSDKFQSDRYLKEYTESEKLDSQISKRVLVVDDDDILREFLDQALTAVNIKVKSVNNAYDALDLLSNERFELVITDIQMPGMDGWELATNIKKSSPETPVILMTGMQMEQVKKIKNSSYDFILYKPFSLKQLETTVTKYLTKGD
jgi:DNA-binding NtrC family response regulator